MPYLCPDIPEHLRPQSHHTRLVEAARAVAQRNAQARQARVAGKSAMEQFSRAVDRLSEYTRESIAIHAAKRRQGGKPRLAAIRARLAALEANTRKPAVPARPRRYWDPDTLAAKLDDLESRIAARNRGEFAPLKRVYSIPVCGPDGNLIPGASAGFRWDDRKGGWIGFRPEQV